MAFVDFACAGKAFPDVRRTPLPSGGRGAGFGAIMANLTRRNEENGQLSSAQREQTGWDPFRLMREMLGWDPFNVAAVSPWIGAFAPSFEMTEKEDAYVLRADLPGVKEEDVEIYLAGNRLTISGHREQERSEERGQTHTSERSFGSFTRSFTLPTGADPEHINAEIDNGVLSVTIAKRPEEQRKRIAVTRRVEGRSGHKGKT
jgi:HSP20 family protein